MGWFRSDAELAATKYAGRESASKEKARKEAARAEHRMPRPSRNAAAAGRAAEDWERKDRATWGRNPFFRR
jgi:hypothetical protein